MPANEPPATSRSKSPGLSSDIDLPSAEGSSLSLKQKVGDAANRWMAKNRSLVLRQTPVWAQGMAAIVISLGSIAFIGSLVFKRDEVVSVQGQLQSVGGSLEIKSPVGGKVAEVFFNDGEMVREGQLLLRFDTRQAADEQKTLKKLIELEEQSLQSRLSMIESQQAMLETRRSVLEKKLQTKTFIINELELLAAQGGFQRITLLEKKDQNLELEAQLTQVTEQQSQLKLQANEIKVNSNKNVSEMRNRLLQAELKLQYQNVVAPSAGIVFDPKVRPSGVLSAGETLLTLVPQGDLFAEVFVSNRDIGFVKTGQVAKIRVDAFPFTRYGELEGRVTHIGAGALEPDSIQNFYRFP